MARQVPVAAKVVGRRHQGPAEMILPDAIDDRAPAKRIAGIDDPVSQSDAAESLLFGLGGEVEFKGLDARSRAGPHFVRGLIDFAALQEVNGARLDRSNRIDLLEI